MKPDAWLLQALVFSSRRVGKLHHHQTMLLSRMIFFRGLTNRESAAVIKKKKSGRTDADVATIKMTNGPVGRMVVRTTYRYVKQYSLLM